MTTKDLQLNPEQAKAASHIEGPMMVLAGPGTGKTQIIAARIAEILKKSQLDPHNILCLTFTESGVVAMRKRLLSMVGSAAYYVRIHTFHSFCNEVIKSHPEKFLQTRELESLSDVERVQIFRSIIEGLPADCILKPFGDPYLYQRDFIYNIQSLKRENISPEDFEQTLNTIESFLEEQQGMIEAFIGIHGSKLREEDVEQMREQLRYSPLAPLLEIYPQGMEKKQRTQFKKTIKKNYEELGKQLPKQRVLVDVYRAYQEELIKRGRYDFEDMILFVVQKFQEDANLLALYQEQFQYILVDEYQDTNGAQNEVVRLIAEYFEAPNLFVVGDDKQSIYRFQGASLENILYFYRLYKDQLELVSLKENYRSQQIILDAAQAVIERNQHSLTHFVPDLDTHLNAAKDHPSKAIRVASLADLQTEHYFLAKEVQRLIKEGTSPSEIAILYRNNRDVDDLVELFLRMEIPFCLEAGSNVLEDSHIHKLIQVFQLLENLEDDHALFFVLHFDFLGFQPLDVLRLSQKARKEKKCYFDCMLETEVFEPFAQKLLSWKGLSINRPLMEFFDHLVKESGYLDFIMAQPDKVEQLNRLNTLFDTLKQMNRSDHTLSLESFLAHLELLTENGIAIKEHALSTKKEGVRLMTAHKSKGLEFDTVFIMNLVDKHWGNVRQRGKLRLPPGLLQNDVRFDEQVQNEDERRLFFVAMTRARKELVLTYSNLNNNGRPQVPSLFLAEIPTDLIEPVDVSKLEDEAHDRLQTIFLDVPKHTDKSEEKAYLQSLLENYVLSVTHLNNYLRCPRLFYYQNLLRVPSSKNKFASFGSAMHEALKDLSLEHQKGEFPSEEFLLEQFEKRLKREVLTEQDFRGGLQLGRQELSDYYKTYQEDFNPSVLPEYSFSSHGVHVDGIPITGQLDKIEILDPEAKTVNVVDYKTGNPDSKYAELKPNGSYHRQIVFYQLLCDLSPKFPYKMVSGEIDFLQKSKKDGRFKRHRYEISEQDIQDLKTTLHEVYDEIKSLSFLDADEWSTCGECEYCRFFNESVVS